MAQDLKAAFMLADDHILSDKDAAGLSAELEVLGIRRLQVPLPLPHGPGRAARSAR